VQTENKLDIIMRDNDKETRVLIDVTIPGERNVWRFEGRNIIIKIQHMWYVKTRVILVIIEATGTIWKSLRQYLSNILGKHKSKKLETTATLGTAHILREVLM